MRSAWSTWRACLLWGLATLVVSQCFALFMPTALAHPIPGATVDNPVLAFEFARNQMDLDAVFGLPADPLRPARIAGMIRGNLFDYLFMVVYGSFVLAFFGASARATGNPRWWLPGWLGPAAGISDAIENALLLAINADMASPARELAFLRLFVWTKFGLLALASALAGWALVRQRAWTVAIPCFAAPLVFIPGIARPWLWGQPAVSAIALGWVAMLGWAAWRCWRDRAATNPLPDSAQSD